MCLKTGGAVCGTCVSGGIKEQTAVAKGQQQPGPAGEGGIGFTAAGRDQTGVEREGERAAAGKEPAQKV